MKLYLIGMMGSGKTTIAKLLSDKLNYKLIDLDNMIESNEKKTITKIFESDGEKYFRELETKALISTIDLVNTVISCGGGIVDKEINHKFLKTGTIIYLEVDIDTLEKRIKDNDNRPLKNVLKDRFIIREPIFNNLFDIKIKNNNIEESVDMIIKKIAY